MLRFPCSLQPPRLPTNLPAESPPVLPGSPTARSELPAVRLESPGVRRVRFPRSSRHPATDFKSSLRRCPSLPRLHRRVTWTTPVRVFSSRFSPSRSSPTASDNSRRRRQDLPSLLVRFCVYETEIDPEITIKLNWPPFKFYV